MTWRDLGNAAKDSVQGVEHEMALITLSMVDGACREELAFYADAERLALRDWSHKGLILIALCGSVGDSLVIVSAHSQAEMQREAAMLPYVMAELATADVQAMMPLLVGGKI